MHSNALIVVASLACGLASQPSRAATPASAPASAPSLPGWVLTFDDEFNGDTIDAAKWNPEDWASTRNHELQYYAPDEVSVSHGCLRLNSQPRDYKGRHYTSGAANTKGKFSQLYGRFEMRAKLPATKGIWPAFWMLPAGGGWPPEIDIMELIGHKPNTVYMTNHWGTAKDHKQNGSPFVGPDFSADFHTFAVEWEKGEIRWYVDGEQRFKSTQGAPDKPFYLLVNTAVGGDWPGKPDTTTVFPQVYEIDYIRAYQRPAAPTTDNATK